MTDQNAKNLIFAQMTKQLLSEGKFVRFGLDTFLEKMVPKEAGQQQRADLTAAFLIGVDHIFSAVEDCVNAKNGKEGGRLFDALVTEVDGARALLKVLMEGAKSNG